MHNCKICFKSRLFHMRVFLRNCNWIRTHNHLVDKRTLNHLAKLAIQSIDDLFFFIWVFFPEHSRFTGRQGKSGAISRTPLYLFYPIHRHLGISRAYTAKSSHLLIASSRTRTGNLWFRASR